jgi:hypothetical protein
LEREKPTSCRFQSVDANVNNVARFRKYDIKRAVIAMHGSEIMIEDLI